MINRAAGAFNMFDQHFTIAEPVPCQQTQHLIPVAFPCHFRKAHPFFPQLNQLIINLLCQLTIFELYLRLNINAASNHIIDKAIQHSTSQIMVFIQMPCLQAQRLTGAIYNRITTAWISFGFSQARGLGSFISTLGFQHLTRRITPQCRLR